MNKKVYLLNIYYGNFGGFDNYAEIRGLEFITSIYDDDIKTYIMEYNVINHDKFLQFQLTEPRVIIKIE